MVAGRTKEEWKQDNPEKTKKQYERDKASAREHYYKNKDNILKKHLEKLNVHFVSA